MKKPSLQIWINHPKKGPIFHSDRLKHYMLMRRHGLPTAGPGFDSVRRGYMRVDPLRKRLDFVAYPHGDDKFTPNDVVNKARGLRKYKGYSISGQDTALLGTGKPGGHAGRGR